MSIGAGNKILWSDIQAIYSQLNSVQTKFNITKTSTPSNPGVAKTTQFSSLRTAIFNLNNNSFIKNSGAITNFNMDVPSVGSLIDDQPFLNMQTALTKALNVCTFNNFDGFDSDCCAGFTPDGDFTQSISVTFGN